MVFVGWTTFYFIFSFNICVRINFLNLFTLMISKNNLLDSRDKNLNWNMLILLSTANWKITLGGGVDCFFHIQFLATRNIFNFCIIYFIKFQQSITFLLINFNIMRTKLTNKLIDKIYGTCTYIITYVIITTFSNLKKTSK